jgi:predicted nucleic acid-binding protein
MQASFMLLAALPIEVDSSTHSEAFAGTLQLARWHHLSVYDASSLQLALRAGHALASLDDELRKAAQRLG